MRLREAINKLDVVKQFIVVTHMEELKGSTDHVISLIPQGKGRQPLVEFD
jgi:DNA repair exonuclease SbcCD ATPase subunit